MTVMMHLHVLGPAFGLPSIDRESIAAVALVKTYCAKTSRSWELVPAHDDVAGSTLPTLYDEAHVVHGYRNIARHLGAISELDEKRKADYAA